MTNPSRLAIAALVISLSVGCAVEGEQDLATMAQDVDRGTYALYQNGIGTVTGMATDSVYFELINTYFDGVGSVIPYAQPIGENIPSQIAIEGLVIANCSDGSQPYFYFVDVFDRGHIATEYGSVVRCPGGTRLVESVLLMLVDF